MRVPTPKDNYFKTKHVRYIYAAIVDALSWWTKLHLDHIESAVDGAIIDQCATE